MDVTKELVQAVKLIQQAREQRRAIAELLGQQDMFGGDANAITEAFVRIFYRGDNFNRARGFDAVNQALAQYLDIVQNTPAQGVDMFGATPDALAILGGINDRIQQQENIPTSGGLFETQPQPKQSSPARPEPSAAGLGASVGESGPAGGRQLGQRGSGEASGAVGDGARAQARSEPAPGALASPPSSTASSIIESVRDLAAAAGAVGGGEAQSTQPQAPSRIQALGDFLGRMRQGKVSLDEYRATFDGFRSNKEAIKQELSSQPKGALLKLLDPAQREYFKSKGRDAIANALMSHAILDQFALTDAYGFDHGQREAAVAKMVESHGQNDLEAYARDFAGDGGGEGPKFSKSGPLTPQEAEFRATEQAYGGRDAYEQAKAEGKTKLGYGQWVQVRTPSFKKWFGDWEIAGSSVKRSASTFDEARDRAREFQGKPLTNKATGIVATVSRNNLDKMLSSKAVGKSETPSIHSAAVANLDALFERAILGWSKPDSEGDVNIKAIHRFFAPVLIDGRAFLAKMTVKETSQESKNNPLYTVEAVSFEATENPAAQWVGEIASADGADPRTIRSAGLIESMAQRVQNFNPSGVSKAIAPKLRTVGGLHGVGIGQSCCNWLMGSGLAVARCL